MTKLLAAGILAAALLTGPQDAPAPREPEFVEITPPVQSAIEKGLQSLARSQASNGAFGSGQAPVATTALAGLAFLAGGHVPGRSKYTPQILACVDYLLRRADRSGYLNESADLGRGGSGMHGHGYAMLFLSQVYGMSNDPAAPEIGKIKGTISRAVRLSEQAQAENGGWYYHPTPSGDEGSVTVTQVQALRAAQNAGIRVNPGTIERAIGYIEKVTGDSGHLRYRWASDDCETTPALTAAGICVLTYLGEYDNPKITKGLESLLRDFRPGSKANTASTASMFYYGNYYATIAMYQAGGALWRTWWPALLETLLAAQTDSGGWGGGETAQYGEAFGTALALLSLEVPYRFLPIFQRGRD